MKTLTAQIFTACFMFIAMFVVQFFFFYTGGFEDGISVMTWTITTLLPFVIALAIWLLHWVIINKNFREFYEGFWDRWQLMVVACCFLLMAFVLFI